MSTRMVILGLLHEQPMYGYEIKSLIEERMGDWTSIAFGSIYHALSKLEAEGMVEQVAVEQEGNRPSRSVYAITEAGRTIFRAMLREAWEDVERSYFTIDLGVFFMPHLPIDEVRALIEGRILTLERKLAYVARHEAEQMDNPHIPLRARAIFAHSVHHLRAELAWTKDLLHQFNEGSSGLMSEPPPAHS